MSLLPVPRIPLPKVGGGGFGKLISSLGGAAPIAGVALGLGSTVLRAFQAASQRRKANKINPIDPGFAANQGILDNKRIVNENYNNYTLPGMEGIKDGLSNSLATNTASLMEGASSSGDVLDGVTKLAYGNDQAINALGIQQAQMKQNLLPEVLNANAMAGNEAVRKNEFDEQRYQAQLGEKAALMGASMQNGFKAVDDLGTLGGSLLSYRTEPYSKDKLKNFKSQGSQYN